MAKKVVALEVTLTAGQAAAELDKLNKAATDTANSVDKVDTEFKTLKQQLKEAQNEAQLMAQKFGDTSKQAIEAQKKVARLKDEVGDFNARVEALNPEAKFRAFAQVAQGVASGFAAAQGAAALFGAESEDVQKALLKLQGAMAIAQGVEGLMGLGDSFKTLKVVAIDAMNGIKTAFLANPLFAIGAVILAGLSAAAVYFASTVDDGTEAIKEQGEIAQRAFDAEAEAIEKNIRLRRAAGEETGELEADKIKVLIKSAQKEIEIAEQVYERKRALAMKQAEDAGILDVLTGNLAVKQANGEKARTAARFKDTEEGKKLYKELSDLQFDLEIKTTENQKKELDKRAANSKEYQDKLKQQREDQRKFDQETSQIIDSDRDRIERNIALLNDDLTALESSYVDKGLKMQNAISIAPVLEENLTALEIFNAELKRVSDDFLEALNGNFGKSQEFALATLTTNLDTAGNFMDAAMNRQLERVKGNEKAQEQIRKTYFERQKKLQIAQALISTYEGATNAFKSTAASPITTLFPAAPYIAAASAIASGLSQVAAIRSTTFEGGSGGGARGAQSIPNLAAPEGGASNTVGSTQLDRESIEQGKPVVIQNNISETEITSTQNRVNRIQARATID
jgi:hypothetical protein